MFAHLFGKHKLSAEWGPLGALKRKGTTGQQISHHPSRGAGQEGGSPAPGIGHLLGDRDRLRPRWAGTSAHGLGWLRGL